MMSAVSLLTVEELEHAPVNVCLGPDAGVGSSAWPCSDADPCDACRALLERVVRYGRRRGGAS